MSRQATGVDADDAWTKRIGGISALALGVAYLVTIPLFASVGAPPSTAQAWLPYLAGKTATWRVILALSVLTDLLYVPFGLTLYLVLRRAHRYAMLVATVFVGLFVVVDLAVTWSNYASLIALGGDYASASTDSQRAALVTAASYPAAVLSSRLEVVYSIGILSLAILVIGVVMLRARFSRVAAYLGIATGVAGVACLSGWNVLVIVNALLATAWIVVVGFLLVRSAGKVVRTTG